MKKRGMLLASISAILFGLLPMVTQFLYAGGLHVIAVSFYRYAFMVPILLLLCIQQKLPLRLSKQDAWHLVISISLFSTATMLLLNSSYLYINTGVATTLHFLYPMFVILICKVVYQDKVDGRTRKSLALMMMGIVCFCINVKVDSMAGLGLALLSAITYAIYLVEMEKKGISKMNPLVFSFYISLFTSLLLLMVNLVVPSFSETITCSLFGWLALLSILSFLGLAALQRGSSYIGATSTALFSLFEPITSLMAGVLFLQEEITIWKISGCVFIFIAVIYLAIAKQTPETI